VLVEVSAEGGREIECGVLGGFGSNPPDVSVPRRIVVDPGHEFYDFAAKYLPEEQTALVVPADLTDQVTARVQQLSVRAFEVLSVEGLARVDFSCCPTTAW
jgi:D-alanine-D-alanine ligase